MTLSEFSAISQKDGVDKKDEDEKDTCNMCGGSGYLDTAQTKICPNCKGTGQA